MNRGVMLKVIEHKKNVFWVFNPIGGRGRHCTLYPNGEIKDTENSMFAELSPAASCVAIRKFIDRKEGSPIN